MTVDYEQLARDYGVSRGAVEALAQAIIRGGGTQAQFNHPELGGMGQWQPGMIMIGDAFNQPLKARVASLCEALAAAAIAGEIAVPRSTRFMQSRWWPAEYGEAAAAGMQNDIAYAFFPQHSRLLIRHGDELTIYDTGEHRITGVSQQQSSHVRNLIFSTERGSVSEAMLTIILTDDL